MPSSYGIKLKTPIIVVFLSCRNVLFVSCPFPIRLPLRVLYIDILKFFTIFDLVKLLNILLNHQCLNSLLPSDLCITLVFKRIYHSYPTRSKNIVKLPHANIIAQGLKRLSSQATLQLNSFLKFCPQLTDHLIV